MTKHAGRGRRASDWLTDRALRGTLALFKVLPYPLRVRLFGGLAAYVIGPAAGYRKRAMDNLRYACPDLPEKQVRRLARSVLDNVGRTLIEMFSGPELIERVRDLPLSGDGVDDLARAQANGTPAVLVTGHFGSYDAARAALSARGCRIGGLYRPMNNAYFNTHYARAMASINSPVFPRGRRGYGQLLKFLKDGGMAAFLIDQYMARGADLVFFGKPAPTALSAAELALKYNAPLIPVYGIRRDNGLDFEIIVESAIPPTDAATMTQAFNDSLEAITRRHMDQWFWIHRRWKPERQRNRAAASTGPDPEV